MSDYHLHLHAHGAAPDEIGDPQAYIERYVEHAAAHGVTELGFTEHLFRCEESRSVLGSFWEAAEHADLSEQARQAVAQDRNLRLDTYVETILEAQGRGLPVRLGLEVDFFPDTIDAVLSLLEPIPFDFLVGSVHWVQGWGIDDSRAAFEFDRRGVAQSYEDYFSAAIELAASGAVDVLGHIDVVKKHGHRLEQEPSDRYRALVAATAASGSAVEVNTAGLRAPIKEAYPSPSLLRMFREADVPITLGSDGHLPHEAAAFHREAVDLARVAGYTHRMKFEQRVGTLVPLQDGAT